MHNGCTKALRYTYIARLVSHRKERIKYLSTHTGRRNRVTVLGINRTVLLCWVSIERCYCAGYQSSGVTVLGIKRAVLLCWVSIELHRRLMVARIKTSKWISKF
jgi:hypothetical protein